MPRNRVRIGIENDVSRAGRHVGRASCRTASRSTLPLASSGSAVARVRRPRGAHARGSVGGDPVPGGVERQVAGHDHGDDRLAPLLVGDADDLGRASTAGCSRSRAGDRDRRARSRRRR